MHHRAVKCAWFFTICLAICGYVLADSNEELRSLSIEELMQTEVVSSTQQSVRLQEAPSTAFVVTGDQIRRWGIRRLSELVDRLVPGAVTEEDVDDQILSFRGITADNNLKVLLLFNGHDYNTQWNNGPSSEVELGLMDDVKRVEVLIGPHSAVYGSGALIAVINIITRSGLDFNGVRATGNYGTGDYKLGELIAGGQPSNELNYFFSAGGLTADGLTNNNNEPLNIYRFPPSWKFYGNVNYKSFELMSRFTRSSRAFYVQKANPEGINKWTNYDTFFIDGRRTFKPNDHLTYVVNFNYDTIETQRHDFTTGIKLRGVGEDRFSGKLTSFYSGLRNHDVVLGAYYRRDEFGDDWEGANYNIDPTIADGQVQGIPENPFEKRTLTPYGRNVYAIFGQDSIKLSENYNLLLGFRFDRIEAPQIPNPNSFTPRVALVFKPATKMILKAMFTSGLSRQPNAAVVSPDSFAFGNPLVTDISKPERMYSGEFSGSYEVSRSLNLTLNVFYNSLQDTFGIDPTLRNDRLITGGRIDYVGFEAIAAANLTEDVFVRVMHQHVQFGSVVNDVLHILTTPDQEHPLNYPEDVTKLLADIRINPTVTLSANANLVWKVFGRTQIGINPETLRNIYATAVTGFFAVVNATGAWNLTPKWRFLFSVSNLFNEQKQIPPLDQFSFLPERNYNMSVAYWF